MLVSIEDYLNFFRNDKQKVAVKYFSTYEKKYDIRKQFTDGGVGLNLIIS